MKHSIIPPKVVFYLGLAVFALGVTSVTTPEFTMGTIIIILGIIISLTGVVTLILRIKNKSENMLMKVLQLIGSGVNIAFGAVLIVIPDVFVNVFIIVIGISFILGGIAQLILTLRFAPITNIGKIFIAIALLMIIAGTIFIINPFDVATAIIVFFGIVAIVYGLTNIIMSFWIKNVITKSNPKQTIHIQDISEKNIETVDNNSQDV